MNSHPEQKISDEAMSDLLASPSTPGSADAELLELKAALRSYRTETLVWAERRSATQPSLAPKAKPSAWAAVPQWSLAAVAVMAVGVGVVHFAGTGSDGMTPADAGSSRATISAPAMSASADQIAADNQLLGSIDQALQYDAVSPTVEYQAQHAPVTHRVMRTEETN